MGKARITDNHGAGLYTIEIIEARERAESAKLQAESRITAYQAELLELEARISTAQDDINAAVIRQDAAVNQYQDDMINTGSSDVELTIYAEDVLKAVRSRDELIAKKRANEIRTLSDQALVDRVNALPPLRQIQAWCADYVEDLSGDVATAEVPGEIGSVIIKPGFDGNTWSASGDGAMQPALASTPAGTFYNLSMLPGWQRWRPTFRTATISNVSGDTCTIALDPAVSSQQGLEVNAQASYSNVPIIYMDCDGEAFEDGDKVLVAFAGNISSPIVVGFESNPKPCNSCIPQIIGESVGTQDWEVLQEFGGMAVTADEWRIINTTQGVVVHSGGVRDESDGRYMNDLPESLPAYIRETVIGPIQHCFPDEDVGYWVEFPAPDPKFWGGQFYNSYDTGPINSDGTLFSNLTGEPREYLYWTIDDCYTFDMDYRTPLQRYVLQLGCQQSDGSVDWPD